MADERLTDARTRQPLGVSERTEADAPRRPKQQAPEPHSADEPLLLVQVEIEIDEPEEAGRSSAFAAAGGSVARAAALIAAVTVLSRLFGFLRTLAFSHTVGHGDLADAYNSANQIPNTIFDIVAGGALASVAVPLLAGPLSRGERGHASQTVSALLTWALAALLPLSVLGLCLAAPLGRLIGGQHGPTGVYAALVGHFLILFLPQIPLYGVAVVLSAALQADRRFLAPAIAPLLSSLVMVATYLAFGGLDPDAGSDIWTLTQNARLVLGLGTTAGVATLAFCLLPAVRRAGFHIRPTFRFAPGVARQALHLAVAGVVTLIAQNLAVLGVVFLTNYADPSGGALTVYNFSWAVYLLPYAVLAVPLATSAFTDLAARADSGDVLGYRAGIAATTRAVLLATCAGAALLAAEAWPTASLFIAPGGTGADASTMAYGLLAFAPGLLGYAAIALLGRVLYAAGHGRDAATATVIGWLTVFALDAVLIFNWPGHAVTALGLGNAVGMTLAAILLMIAVRRRVGHGVFDGLGRTGAAGGIAAVAAGAAGWMLGTWFGWTNSGAALLVAPLCGTLTLVVFGAVVLPLDGAELRPLVLRALAQFPRIRHGSSDGRG
ncbi:murein biosynthesis integral membrane protein MurJ [Actinospica sp.]|uniref:murein biosynthesis integral membrane protein MurJ n=1 Tax=Actinospica sp. TaxID=1872142 RepID=UPI002B5EA43B|nr:lipid II flippase MurJ [Actinospica sp.]HWG27806.1 lipid II flippase MurJ [Actinospica sp.]